MNGHSHNRRDLSSTWQCPGGHPGHDPPHIYEVSGGGRSGGGRIAHDPDGIVVIKNIDGDAQHGINYHDHALQLVTVDETACPRPRGDDPFIKMGFASGGVRGGSRRAATC